jgi:adenylate cyclase
MPSSTNNQLGFQPAAIEAQLERIIASNRFLVAEQRSSFLRFVVAETLAGRQDAIKQYTIAVRALGRDPNFNPQADPIVRMQAGRLRRALHRYYETDGVNDPIRIDIPTGRYVPLFLPHQAVPQNSRSRSEQATPTLAAENMPGSVPDGPSIAVLPLEYLGNEADHAFFATGLTEEIIIALTRFPEFLVVGPLDREIIKQKHLGPRGIGREYNVRFVLDGTVRLRGQTLRITARLTDALKGHQLWGETHDYSLETASLDQIENEVVGQVVATVADAYGVVLRALSKESLVHHADSLSDYEAILRFYHHFSVLTEESYANAVASLEKTLQRDPNHALAAGMLADLIVTPYQYGYDDSPALLEQGEVLARKAVVLDPNCQQARFTMALIYFLRFQRTQFLAEAEKTLQLNPNHALSVAVLALHIGMAGEWERGLQLITKAMRLNPHHPGWYHLVPYMIYYRQGEYDLAWIEAKRFNIPAFHWDPLIRAAVLGQLGRQVEAKKAVDELLALVPDFEHRGKIIIRRFAYLDEHVDMLVDGLRKAGLEIEQVAS